jgi:hypothetical protein
MSCVQLALALSVHMFDQLGPLGVAGDRRAARIAGSSPASAPMSGGATTPPAPASAGMTVAHPLPSA